MVGDYIERAYHRAHAAGDTFSGIDEHNLREILRPMDRVRRTSGYAWCWVTMSAFVWKRGVQAQSRFGVDKRFRDRGFKYRPEQVLALGMSDCTCGLTLLAADAALRVNEYSLHMASPLSRVSALTKRHDVSSGWRQVSLLGLLVLRPPFQELARRLLKAGDKRPAIWEDTSAGPRAADNDVD